MPDRKKLIDLLMDKPFGNSTEEREIAHAEDVAEYLIANGVTVRERGRWILQRYYGGLRKGMVARIICSECGYPNEKTNFCPNCGADMGGEEDGNET